MEEKNLIRLETSPVIDYGGIEGISQLVDKRIKALDLDKQVATEDTVKKLKEIRASLNKEFNKYESQRKAIKASIIDPYNKFEAQYKNLISIKYQDADNTLKEKIYSVEDRIKKEKTDKVQKYFDEYCQSKEINFLRFSQTGVNVTLSASEKSLKEEVSTFVDDVKKDLDAINVVPGDDTFRAEILIEYKKTLDIVSAIEDVSKRRKILKEAAEKAEAKPEPVKMTPAESFHAPIVEEEEKVFTVSFAVTGTISKLKLLKQYMIDNNLTFKNI